MTAEILLGRDRDLLVRLLEIPTAGPFELVPGDPAPQLWAAQRAYAEAAGELGFVTIHHRVPLREEVEGPDVPLAVLGALDDIPGFLADQPSMVLRLGPSLPRHSTVMFNVHLDTVSGLEKVCFDGSFFRGRGAIDAKGPAIALLSGIRAAVLRDPAIGKSVGVLVQVVSGEEGGAMGTVGTRPLVEQGYVGRLNVFCEPTKLLYLPRATASMTACVRVDGRDSVDDRSEQGHNATVLLGFLAQHLALALAPQVGNGALCIAGIHTGSLHNRVYGSGRLLVNLSYPSPEAGRRLGLALEDAVVEGLAEFTRRFSSIQPFSLTAADAAAITSLEWHKQNMPTLSGTDRWCEDLLERTAGLSRWPDDQPAFSCDAIWMHAVPDTSTVVLGPGDLATNHAHASGEFASLIELEGFAGAVSRLLLGFAAGQRGDSRRATTEWVSP